MAVCRHRHRRRRLTLLGRAGGQPAQLLLTSIQPYDPPLLLAASGSLPSRLRIFQRIPSSRPMSLTPPPAARLAALARLRSTVLQLPYNPLGLRTGLHYLTKPLRGPEVSAWYPLRLDDRVTRSVLNLPKEWKNERWSLWNEARERRLAKGKVPVKKGQSALLCLAILPVVSDRRRGGRGGPCWRDLRLTATRPTPLACFTSTPPARRRNSLTACHPLSLPCRTTSRPRKEGRPAYKAWMNCRPATDLMKPSLHDALQNRTSKGRRLTSAD